MQWARVMVQQAWVMVRNTLHLPNSMVRSSRTIAIMVNVVRQESIRNCLSSEDTLSLTKLMLVRLGLDPPTKMTAMLDHKLIIYRFVCFTIR